MMPPMNSVTVESPTPVLDLVRVLTVFVPGALVLALTIFVVIAYYRAYRLDKFKKARTGLLPHHVWMIGVSYLLFAADGVWATAQRVREEFSPHLLLLAPAFLFGVAALYMVLQFERLRYRAEAPAMKEIDDMDLPQV